MAQSQNQNPTPNPTNGVDPEADLAAWNKALLARKYIVHEGVVQLRIGDMIVDLPAPPGFAALPASHQPMMAHAVANLVSYRVGQQAEGDVAAVVANTMATGVIPASNSNDAFEAVYRAFINDKIKTARGDDKSVEPAVLDATVEHYRNGDDVHLRYDTVIAAARAAGHNKPLKARKRVVRGPNTDKAVALA